MIKKIKHILLAPVYALYKLWIGLVFWSTLLALYPFFRVLLSKERWYPQAFKLKKFWSRCFQVFLFCPVRIVLTAPLPKPPYIIVSNHCSYLDTVFMYSVIPDYFLFVGKGELLKWPLFRRFFKTMDIPVHREHSRKSYQALQKAYTNIDHGACIALYPEGTIPTHAPCMKAFKNGAFKMAMDKKIPIVPITWQTNHRIMLEPSRLFEFSLPQKVRVVIHEAIVPTGSSEADLVHLRNTTFHSIASAIPLMQKSPNQS